MKIFKLQSICYATKCVSCILAGVTADHRVVLYGNSRWSWRELDQPSLHWYEYLKSRKWVDVCDEDDNHSEVFSQFKSRSYMLGTVAISWSGTYGNSSSKWAWLVCLQRSGHAVIWKAEAPFDRVKFETYYDLKVQSPSSLKLFPCGEGSFADG